MKVFSSVGAHPYQLWERQAKALASVEKTEKLKKKWEKNLSNP